MDWLTKSAAEQGRAIGDGSLDPVDLTEAYLDAAEAHPDGTRIYARLTEDRAHQEAISAHDRAKNGFRLGPLDGVPISWKDLFDTHGVATEAGTALLKGRVPSHDALVLRNATAQGLVCLGKTHMTELAFSGLGLNPVTATPPNINGEDLVPGGSSSGAAASVAHGLAAASIGSDTGGSVRVPAAWNDLVGLKTSSGRLSLEGVVPLCLRFDTVGPLTRSVEDAALLLAAMEGEGASDLRGASLKGRSFVVCESVAFDDIEDAPAAAFEDALSRLSKAGAEITRRAFASVTAAMALTGPLYPTEAYGLSRDLIESAPDKMFPEILARFRGGKDFSAPDYVAAWNELERHRRSFWEAVAGSDAVLVPTAPILPPSVSRLTSDPAYFKERNLLTLRNTRIGNLMDASVLTLPTGTPSCGLSLMTPPRTEERLLRLGHAAEAALS
ncbi:MAG: amidase family protein [Pseudomonadota bacterium]